MVKIELLRCPDHGHEALFIGNVRITAGKCCGRWHAVRNFDLTTDPAELENLIIEELDRMDRESS